MDVSVTAVLDIDGKEVTARKVQKRKYKKDGVGYSDDNTYFINEVPKTLKAFNEYFEIDMNLLKMCSSPGAFLNQKTADMRSYLFGLVENVNDLDVAKENSELSAITDLLEKYSADELTAMNKATKSKIEKDLPVIDGQIKEKQRDIGKDSIGESVRGGKAKRFIPPNVEEVESYCSERGNGIDAQSFIDFYESKGWMIGKNKMKDWKAAVRTWERSRNKNSTEKSKTVFDEWRES